MSPKAQRLCQTLAAQGIQAANVLEAIAQVPREAFIAPALASQAYDNTTLPIAEGQTISQPYVVAFMTQTLDLQPTHKVLEIGTGCGYQTALLCRLARRVYTIERFKSLSQTAEAALQRLGYHNYSALVGDGHQGWPNQAPFDRIIVTAGATHIPPDLLQQLAPNGVMVLPVGPHEGQQQLVRVAKDAAGEVTHQLLGAVKFVPMVASNPAPVIQQRRRADAV